MAELKRDSKSHRKIARNDDEVLKKAEFKVGDVCVTKERVKVFNSLGKAEGYASPGWQWRVVKVYVGFRAGSPCLLYDCVAHSEPLAYTRTMRTFELSHRVGRHEGDLLGRKVKEPK